MTNAARGIRAAALGALVCAGCVAHSPPAGPPGATSAPRPVPPLQAPPSPLPVLPPAAERTRGQALADTLDGLLARRAFERASIGLVVRSLASGETLYRHNGATWLVPASTQKVLTVVAAADRLGWNFRFETRLLATGPLVDGTLTGDLIAVGTGDPTINPRHPSRVDTFDDWARALRAKGVRRIAGHVVGDDHAVSEPGWGIGWAWDDLSEGYGSPYGALQYRENEVQVVVGPGMTPGAPALVALSPAQHGLLVENLAVTAAPDAAAWLAVSRVAGTRFLRVEGDVPLGSDARTTTTATHNATLYFASELRAALIRHGIVVDGAAADIDELVPPPGREQAETLLVDLSPPLSEIVDPLLKWSLNGYAETLLMALDPTPPASADEGLDVLRQTLAALGVDPASYSTRDGSGLSRNDYMSADALVATLAGAWNRPDLRGPLMAALPHAGRTGGLAERLRGTPAEARVWAKTGSMSNVRSLAGYVETAGGEPLAFAILTNGFDVRGVDIDAEVDAILLALVALPR